MSPRLTSLLLAASILAFGASADAGPTGYPSRHHGGGCAESKFQTPRYDQSLPLRHYENPRRYRPRHHHTSRCRGETAPRAPYLVKTVIVRKKRVPHYYYDRRGNRHCRRVLVVTYKDIYSDGSCYVWREQRA